MWSKLGGFAMVVYGAIHWVTWEFIKAWFFDKVVHQVKPLEPVGLELLIQYGVHYGVAVLCVLVGFWLLIRKPKTDQLPQLVADTAPKIAITSPSYLRDRDTEMSHAIVMMVWKSAWAKWFAAQTLTASHFAGVSESSRERGLLSLASSLVVDKAMNGELEIRGRPSDSKNYEVIAREDWRLAFLDPEPNPNSIWKMVVKPRTGESPDRIKRLLDYDSLIVDSTQFQELWPAQDAANDKARKELLKAAKISGVPQSEIEKLL